MDADLAAFLDALADAVGPHRLQEFCDNLAAYPPITDPADLPEEAQDMLQEMHRLRPPEQVRHYLQTLRDRPDEVAAYLARHG